MNHERTVLQTRKGYIYVGIYDLRLHICRIKRSLNHLCMKPLGINTVFIDSEAHSAF